jgi:hypothetical protein
MQIPLQTIRSQLNPGSQRESCECANSHWPPPQAELKGRQDLSGHRGYEFLEQGSVGDSGSRLVDGLIIMRVAISILAESA